MPNLVEITRISSKDKQDIDFVKLAIYNIFLIFVKNMCYLYRALYEYFVIIEILLFSF